MTQTSQTHKQTVKQNVNKEYTDQPFVSFFLLTATVYTLPHCHMLHDQWLMSLFLQTTVFEAQHFSAQSALKLRRKSLKPVSNLKRAILCQLSERRLFKANNLFWLRRKIGQMHIATSKTMAEKICWTTVTSKFKSNTLKTVGNLDCTWLESFTTRNVFTTAPGQQKLETTIRTCRWTRNVWLRNLVFSAATDADAFERKNHFAGFLLKISTCQHPQVLLQCHFQFSSPFLVILHFLQQGGLQRILQWHETAIYFTQHEVTSTRIQCNEQGHVSKRAMSVRVTEILDTTLPPDDQRTGMDTGRISDAFVILIVIQVVLTEIECPSSHPCHL